MAGAFLALAVSVFLAHHLLHYAARAEAHQRTILAEIIAAPLCTGAP